MTIDKPSPAGPAGPVSLDAPDMLDAPAPAAPLSALEPAAAAPEPLSADPVAEIARALSAHEISAEHAVISMVEHALQQGAVSALSADERAALRDHLMDLLADDPMLSGMVARLGAAPDPSGA